MSIKVAGNARGFMQVGIRIPSAQPTVNPFFILIAESMNKC